MNIALTLDSGPALTVTRYERERPPIEGPPRGMFRTFLPGGVSIWTIDVQGMTSWDGREHHAELAIDGERHAGTARIEGARKDADGTVTTTVQMVTKDVP